MEGLLSPFPTSCCCDGWSLEAACCVGKMPCETVCFGNVPCETSSTSLSSGIVMTSAAVAIVVCCCCSGVVVPHVEVLLQAVAFLRHLVVQGAVCSALHAVKLVALLLPAKKLVVLLTELVVWEM